MRAVERFVVGHDDLLSLTITPLRSCVVPCQGKAWVLEDFSSISMGRIATMNNRLSRANIPIANVVVAFQPRQLGVSWYGMEPGRVALFRLGDTRVHLFDCHDGACWAGWRDNPDRQLEWLLEL